MSHQALAAPFYRLKQYLRLLAAGIFMQETLSTRAPYSAAVSIMTGNDH